MQDFRELTLQKIPGVHLWQKPGLWLRDFVLPQLELQRTHIFLWFPVFLGAGIATYFGLPVEPDFGVSLVFVLLSLQALYFLKEHDFWRNFLLLMLCAALGFACASLRTAAVHTPILSKEIKFADVQGVIRNVEHLPGKEGLRVILKDVQIEDLSDEKTPRMVRIKIRGTHDLRAGQKIEVLAGLNPPSPPVVPGGFDFQRYMFFKSIGAVGFSYGAPRVIHSPENSGLLSGFENFRARIVLGLGEALGQRGAVVSALMVGQRSGITDEDRDAMRDAGLAHMLAISGLHVGLFFGVVFFSARLLMAYIPVLALGHPIKKYAAVFAMLAAIFYMLVAGMTIPTQRAVLMTGAVFVAILLERTPMSMRLVAFAAMVVLIFSPESLISASFQMSFAAVVGLVAFYKAIRPYWSACHRKAGFMRRAGLYLAGVSMTTVIATAATAPFALFHFQQLAIYSLLSNILAMPILAFVVMPFIVLYFVLLPFGLEGVTLPVLGWGVGLVLDVAHYVSSLEHATVHTSLWPVYAMIVYVVGFLMLTLFEGRLRVISALPLLIFTGLIFTLKQPDILISSSSDLMASKTQSGSLLFSGLQKDRFVRGQWMQAYGLEDMKAEKWPKEGAAGDLACGEQGCRQERNGYRISYLKDLDGFKDECGWADILIGFDPLPDCEDTIIVDRFDTYRNGAYGLYLGREIKVIGIRETRGKRPWVARY